MNQEQWLDEWDTASLYQKEVEGCDNCDESSPISQDGVVCGPLLRLKGVDYDNDIYRGSLLLVVKGTNPPAVKFAAGHSTSNEIDIEIRQLNSTLIHEEKDFSFFRYDFDLSLRDFEQMIKYSVGDVTKPHYRFYIPSKDMNFNTISYSCNGFSLSVDTTKFKGSMWFDILKKHSNVHYHVMLGGGDQIYSDSVKLYCHKFKKWLETKNPIAKFKAKLTSEMKEDLNAFYLKEYIEWYGYGYWKGATPQSKTTQRCFPLATATVPSINIYDDHDIIDGFGSYSNSFQSNDVFSGVGKAAYKYYMLFQHHVSLTEKKAYSEDPSWILGAKKGPYIGEKSHSVLTRLGPTWALLGLDCRTERQLRQIVDWKTYDIIFDRLAKEVEKGKLDHLMVMLGVPIAYPRLVWLEWLFSSRLLAPLKYLSKKGVFARGLVNEFNGDVEVLDDLNDHWCARHHKKERNYLVAKLQDFGAKYGIRITILSGDVHLAAVGRFRSKLHSHHITSSHEHEVQKFLDEPEKDTRLMFNVISSAVVNTPPPNAMAALLQKRSGIHHFDSETDEDVVPLFHEDVDGHSRKNFSFMNRRNWSDLLPIANVLAQDYLQQEFQLSVGERYFPGIITSSKSEKATKKENSSDQQDVSYPATAKGMLATIHVEQNTLNADSESVAYSVVIPELSVVKDKLSHKGIKHLNL